MGYLDELNTTIKTITNISNKVDSLSHKSVARGALDGTLQFSCLVSDSLPIMESTVLARSLERVYASFVQSYLSLNSTIDISVDKNPYQFLKKFHHNVKVVESSYDGDDYYSELMERVYDGSTKLFINENENLGIIFDCRKESMRSIYESNKELLEETLAGVDFKPFPNIGNSKFYEYQDESLQNFKAKKDYENLLSQNLEKQKAMYGNKNQVPILMDKDVKKTNDMQPYMMQVRLMAINDKNEFVQFMDFVVGVKVVLHPIKSNEMCVNIQHAIQNNGKFFKFIRWTSGELSLVKDLLLNINDTKLDVSNKSKGASPWWMTLKRMKETSKMQSAFFSKNKIVPNATIVLTSVETDYIKENYGYDLHDVRIAKKLMSSLFLMNFVIVDQATETIEILYDGENTYQVYALETLQREVDMSSNKLGRELTRMISR